MLHSHSLAILQARLVQAKRHLSPLRPGPVQLLLVWGVLGVALPLLRWLEFQSYQSLLPYFAMAALLGACSSTAAIHKDRRHALIEDLRRTPMQRDHYLRGNLVFARLYAMFGAGVALGLAILMMRCQGFDFATTQFSLHLQPLACPDFASSLGFASFVCLSLVMLCVVVFSSQLGALFALSFRGRTQALLSSLVASGMVGFAIAQAFAWLHIPRPLRLVLQRIDPNWVAPLEQAKSQLSPLFSWLPVPPSTLGLCLLALPLCVGTWMLAQLTRRQLTRIWK